MCGLLSACRLLSVCKLLLVCRFLSAGRLLPMRRPLPACRLLPACRRLPVCRLLTACRVLPSIPRYYLLSKGTFQQVMSSSLLYYCATTASIWLLQDSTWYIIIGYAFNSFKSFKIHCDDQNISKLRSQALTMQNFHLMNRDDLQKICRLSQIKVWRIISEFW